MSKKDQFSKEDAKLLEQARDMAQFSDAVPPVKEALFRLLDQCEAMRVAYERMDGLRRLCGSFMNGGDTVVSIFQDDACRSYHVKVGKRLYSDDGSWSGALQKAIDANPEED